MVQYIGRRLKEVYGVGQSLPKWHKEWSRSPGVAPGSDAQGGPNRELPKESLELGNFTA